MTVLIVLIVISVLAAAATVTITGVALVRQNRVVAGVRSPAPIGWLTSSRREARLHRRLRSVGRRLELVPETEDISDVLTGLRVELVELDSHLVTVARRPSVHRRADRRGIVKRIEAIEDLAHRIEERARTHTGSISELTERLDMLEAADEELRGIDPGGA